MADSSADRLAVIHRHLTKDSGTSFYAYFLYFLLAETTDIDSCDSCESLRVISLNLAPVLFSLLRNRVQTKPVFDIYGSDRLPTFYLLFII